MSYLLSIFLNVTTFKNIIALAIAKAILNRRILKYSSVI